MMHVAFQRKIAAESVKRLKQQGRAQSIRYFGQAMKDATEEERKAVRELVVSYRGGGK